MKLEQYELETMDEVLEVLSLIEGCMDDSPLQERASMALREFKTMLLDALVVEEE